MRSPSKYLVLTVDYLLPGFFLLSFVLGYLLSFHTSFFYLSQLECRLDYKPCEPSHLTSELDKLKGQNLLTLSLDELEAKLMSGEYTLRLATITKHYPRTLTIDLFSTTPVIALQLQEEPTQWFVLDERLRLLSLTVDDPHLPTLRLDSLPPLQLGQAITDPVLSQVLTLAHQIVIDLPRVQTMTLGTDQTLTLVLSDGLTALLSPRGDLSSQLEVLKSLLTDPKVTNNYSLLDVRYSHPVLK